MKKSEWVYGLLMVFFFTGQAWAVEGKIDVVLHPQGKTCDAAVQKIKKMDKNHDGQVTQAEFIDAATQKAKKIFAKKDTNGDGFLSDADYLVTPQRLKRVDRFFKHYDSNHDGLVSKDEMLGQK